MPARLLATLVLAFLVAPVDAQEAIPATTLKTIKDATVFVKIKSDFSYGSGSGFLIHTDKDFGYIVTNRHVVVDNPFGLEGFKKRELQAVFQSGTDDEFVLNADVLGVLQTEDLAILRVRGSKKLPRPLDLEAKQIPTETTTLYGFGFPFGKLLASSKGSPEISVSRVTVSSLRRNDRKELKAIQLDGSLNPGNSGGPVTDSKGRVIGVVVSGVRGASVSLAIPAAEVVKLMDGSALGARFEAKKVDDKGTQVAITADLLDPKANLKTIGFRYVREDLLTIEPDRDDPSPLPKATSVTLDRSGVSATGSMALKAADRGKIFWFQLSYAAADGVVRHTTPQSFRVSASGKISSLGAELDQLKGDYLVLIYSIADVRARGEIEAKMRALAGKKSVARTLTFGSKRRMEFYPIDDPRAFVEKLDEEIGKVTRIDGNVVTLEIEIPAELARAAELYAKFEALKVKGADPKAAVHKPDILAADEWKRIAAAVEKKEVRKSGAPGGAGHDGPEDLLGEGGIVIGVNITTGQFIQSIQPIYLTAKGEKVGKQIGAAAGKLHTFKAEPGYAVGALNLRNGDLLDAVTIVFMKMMQDSLDVNDAYRSPQLGGSGGNAITVGGDGAFILGFQSKTLPAAFIAPKDAVTSIGVISAKK